MSLTPFAALVSVLIGSACGAGEGNPHGTGFAVAGGVLGAVIGMIGGWGLFRFENSRLHENWGNLRRTIGSLAWASAILWLPLLVGVVAVLSSAALVRVLG